MNTRLIDALCRIRIGWSGSIPGDGEDFHAADKLVVDRGDAVRGSFRKPTEVERYRTALIKISDDDPSGKWGRWAREALSFSSEEQTKP